MFSGTSLSRGKFSLSKVVHWIFVKTFLIITGKDLKKKTLENMNK